MFYYKITVSTPYCGTEVEEYYAFHTKPTREELDDLVETISRDNAEGYEYLVTGWDDDEVEGMTEDEIQEVLDNYYADCSGHWEEISHEEYEENT